MNILIAAVGGQGALLASRILGTLAQELKYDVKVSEVHGMSQRGGSVVAYVRFGEKVYSPVVEKGTADVILGFERLEAARYVDYLNENGVLIMNTQSIYPMPVITGQMAYPSMLMPDLERLDIKVAAVDALKMAKDSGNIKSVNVALLGAMAGIFDIDKKMWTQAILKNVPAKLAEINLKAFEAGYAITSEMVLK